jgi:predicted adenylyl cyclase CyaB
MMMPTETECKIPVADFASIEAKLNELRAESHGEFLQNDMFFDSPNHRLLRADQGLRLRSVRPAGDDTAAQHVLTYKGARQPGALKQREEIEVVVADPRAMADVLRRLGLDLMLHLQKRRKRYRLEDCWVELDTVPLLNRFVEVEGPRQEVIIHVVGQLGLDPSRGITDSYASLLMAEARKRGLPTSPAEFLLDPKPSDL